MRSPLKKIVLIPYLISVFAFGQLPVNSLIGLPTATTLDINTLSPSIGSMVYNTDDNHVYIYSGTKFEKTLYENGNYVGAFQISASGTKTITGLPFKPSKITFKAYLNVEDFNLDSDNDVGNNFRGVTNSFGSMSGSAMTSGSMISQQVINTGAHGRSLNNISRYAANDKCIGVRFGDQNGNDLGKIEGSLISFDTSGFTLDIAYTEGTVTYFNILTPFDTVSPSDISNEGLIVIYYATR